MKILPLILLLSFVTACVRDPTYELNHPIACKTIDPRTGINYLEEWEYCERNSSVCNLTADEFVLYRECLK